jgi:glycosyltransferase involved in cell wall biosynthesis
MKKILVVGQTPPPFGGQALMIDYMLNGNYEKIKFFHVRMCFSKEMDQRGKFSFYKFFHLLSIIIHIYKFRIKYKIDAIYYPPSNSPKISIYRDIIILFFTRVIFRKTIFHFHAAGISEMLPTMKFLEQKIIYHCLRKPDLAISSSEFNPKDGEYLKAKKNCIIPLGIPDENITTYEKKKNDGILNVLFVGLMNSTKGEGYILEAMNILNKKSLPIRLTLAGKFETEEYRQDFFKKAADYGLSDNIKYKGVVQGEEKRMVFLESDVFCFPSFFISESFGIVLLEAMQYGLPLIATRWRGIQSIVEQDKNGFLIETRSANQIAESIEFFIKNPHKLQEFGRKSREIYLEKYTLKKYLSVLETELCAL